MKSIFPCYSSSFSCDCTIDEAAERIRNAAERESNDLKTVKAYHTGDPKIVLRSHTGSYLYVNSSKPLVSVGLREEGGKTQISVLFELQKSVKVLIAFLSTLALVLEMAVIVLSIVNRSVSVGLLLPVIILGFSCILSTLGLYVSSKGVMRILFDALTCGSAERIPRLKICTGEFD